MMSSQINVISMLSRSFVPVKVSLGTPLAFPHGPVDVQGEIAYDCEAEAVAIDG